MSQENVETVRDVYEALNRRDWDAVFRDAYPDFVVQLPEAGMNVGSFQGRDGLVKLFENYSEAFDFFHIEPEEFFEADEQVVVFVRIPARGRGSGAEVGLRSAHVWTMRATKAARLEVFPDRREALQAAGLSE
jgi:ketosteroid isomerase-like protein